jgi:ADP-heptose:LPS heptosyltransferase
MLAPLARVHGASFYSLQVGAAAAQAASPPPGVRLVDHSARLRDFADTAALISLLDVLVTIDTSVCHLGGALGARTWVMLAFAADWRFHLEREDNPWYPTMRLFRQPRDGDWTGAVEKIADELLRIEWRP